MNVVLWVLVAVGFFNEIWTLSRNSQKINTNELPDDLSTSTPKIRYSILNSSKRPEDKEVSPRFKIGAGVSSRQLTTLESAEITTSKTKFTTEISPSSFLNETSSTTIEISSTNIDTGISSSTEQSTFSQYPIDDEINATTTESNCPELPEIQLSVETNSFNVTLNWIPENSDCVTEYIIYLDEKNITTTNELTYTIDELYACTNYTVGVAATDGVNVGKTAPQDITTSTHLNLNSSSVHDLTVTEDEEANILNVTWSEPPDEVLQCVTSYYVIWWDQQFPNHSNDPLEIKAPQTYATLDIIGCTNYTIQVTPQAGKNQGILNQVDYQSGPRVPKPPEVLFSKHGKDHINVTCITDSKNENKCPVQEIFVDCIASSSNNFNYSWIVWEVPVVETITIQTVNNRYPVTVNRLSPFTNYTCYAVIRNEAGNSSVSTGIEIRTDQEKSLPPEPVIITNLTPNEFTIEWTEPLEVPGVLTGYTIRVENNGPLYTPLQECAPNWTTFNLTVGPENTRYIFPHGLSYHDIAVSVTATDDAGESLPATTNVTTPSSEPDSVVNPRRKPPVYSESEIYYAVVTISFDPPCNINGHFKNYAVEYKGVRPVFPDHTNSTSTNDTTINIELEPERSYSFQIQVITENFTSQAVSVERLVSKPGVPRLSSNISNSMIVDTTYFTLHKNTFDNLNGEIVAWAVFLFTSGNYASSYGFWDGSEDGWPDPPQNSCQLTCNLWNPFNTSDGPTNFTISISNTNCSCSVCKMPLTEDTDYWLLVRAFTTAAYKDSNLLHFKLDMLDDLNLGLILGLTFGLLALVVLVVLIIFLWRKKRKAVIYEEEKRISVASVPAPIPVQKFAGYYISIKEDYNILKQQYSDLGVQSKDVTGTITYATLTENRRKNRYTNILPFDETRVKLNIDEDDEICSDYINASYIKGYSGKIEYIATQGPLESTTRDFWKMVLQENVSIIVMVSQFVEQSKEKCFQYFPNNHESTTFGENLEVKCSTELHFGTYCMRTLQVRKGAEQRHVIHMQFLEWPDFGVPQGTDNMLQFCNVLREKANCEGGLIVVHCSAGVGRTGTLIALDILLQTIDDHRDINIYKTVFDLRKQRINMVQTEKQYMFIHSCVKEYIETPTIPQNDSGGEQIYENMDVIRSSSLKKNLIETEIESAF